MSAAAERGHGGMDTKGVDRFGSSEAYAYVQDGRHCVTSSDGGANGVLGDGHQAGDHRISAKSELVHQPALHEQSVETNIKVELLAWVRAIDVRYDVIEWGIWYLVPSGIMFSQTKLCF